MAMAAGAVHLALTKAGVRAEVGIAVDAADCREIHHVAVLLGMGVGAVCPWLALETARSLNPEKGEQNLLHALEWDWQKSCRRWASASSIVIAAPSF